MGKCVGQPQTQQPFFRWRSLLSRGSDTSFEDATLPAHSFSSSQINGVFSWNALPLCLLVSRWELATPYGCLAKYVISHPMRLIHKGWENICKFPTLALPHKVGYICYFRPWNVPNSEISMTGHHPLPLYGDYKRKSMKQWTTRMSRNRNDN